MKKLWMLKKKKREEYEQKKKLLKESGLAFLLHARHWSETSQHVDVGAMWYDCIRVQRFICKSLYLPLRRASEIMKNYFDCDAVIFFFVFRQAFFRMSPNHADYYSLCCSQTKIKSFWLIKQVVLLSKANL